MGYLVRQMGYMVFGTPHPVASAQDLSAMIGARVIATSDAMATLSCNTRRVEVGFVKSDRSAMLAYGLEAVSAGAIDEIERRAVHAGCEVLSRRSYFDFVEKAVRLRTPHGPVFEVHTAVPRDLDQPPVGGHCRSRRLEHANLQVEDALGLGDLCRSVFGLQLSDRTENDEILWLRAADGFHHTVAIGQGEPKLRHYAFDVHSIEDIGNLADELVRQGRKMVWGPGRHGAGNNVFGYFIDADGCAVEASFGMVRIDNDALYEVQTWSLGPESNLRNQWGSLPTPAYGPAGLALADHP